MNDDLCLYDVSDGVALVTLNRPERNNGMNGELEIAYLTRLQQAAADREVRAIVVTGAGKSFCPGADLGGPGSTEPLPNTKIPVDAAMRIEKPLIAAINGGCAGVGLVQALYCDIRFAAAGVKLTTAFARRGLIAEYGMGWLLPRIVGRGAALDLLMSARTFTAEEALAIGLVNRVCSAETLVADAMAYARDLAVNVSPSSMATIKRQIGRYDWMDWDGALDDSNVLMRQSMGPDSKEGIGAFVARRAPDFAPLGEGTTFPWMERPGAPRGIRGLAPEGLAPAQGFQHAVEAAGGRMVMIAGQVAQDANGTLVGKGDLAAQTAQALRNVETALAAAGLTSADVVKLNYYIVGLDTDKVAQFGAGAVAARASGVKLPRAAATMVGVTGLVSPDYLVEIEAIAVR